MADINLTAAEVAQLILSIGNAAALSTKDKTSLVAAINETLATAEAGGSPKAEKVSYSGNIDGTTVANVKAALDQLSARQGVLTVNATYNNTSGAVSADCTYEQISAAVAQKKSVICIVTATLGAKAVLTLATLSDSAAIFRAPAVNGGAVGIQTLTLGKNTGTWTMDVDLDKALCFTDEVAFPTVKGETLDLTGFAFWPRDPEVGELVVGANGYTGEVTALAADGDPIITATGERIFTFAASDITYSGTIGETTVANVKAALDALAIGQPLDMSADFVASSKDDISDWAVEAAAGSTTEYRIAPGIYQIRDTVGNMIVTIVDDPTGKRLVKQEKINADGVYYLYIGTAMAPGSYSETIYFGADDGPVSINGRTATLPWYNTSDAGKVPVVDGNFVKWKNLIPQIEITLSSGASPAITSVTKDGVSVGSTVAEWANAVHEAVQKNWPIAFVLDNRYYRPSDVQWSDTSTMLQYLYFSGPSDISLFFQICVWLYTDGRVPEITIDDQL